MLMRQRAISDATVAEFAKYDADQSGGIEKEEMKVLLKSRGFSLSQEYVDKMWAALDVDSSGTLEVAEFQVLIKQLTAKSSETAASNAKPAVDSQPSVTNAAGPKSTLAVTVVGASGLNWIRGGTQLQKMTQVRWRRCRTATHMWWSR